MTEDINVSFVIRKDCENDFQCSEEMQLAYVSCEQHRGGGVKACWVQESEITKFEGLSKKDVFVLNEFAGDIFEKLRATKCLLLGPRCLSCCLTEGTPIPSGPEPVFTVAMRGLVVSASGLSKQQKELIKRRVQWMGGMYNSDLTDGTTHLVCDTVLSDKYIKSVEKGIPVMSEQWVNSVWEMSHRMNINGSSTDFDSKRLPPFFNLQVTTSGIGKRDKQLIMKLVNENGGTFTGAFQSETTDVVVLTKDGIGSEKYKAALEYGKACVLPSWIKDSAMRGVALPFPKYRVAGASTSSPLAEHRLPDMSLNFSRITNLKPPPSGFIDETKSVDLSVMSTKSKLSQDNRKSTDSVDREVQAAFETFDMSIIKKAGPIFDGFCIWVGGPEGAWREKACACVSRGGGVRYDAPHDRVTHVVAGNRIAALLAAKRLPAVPTLSAVWLTESLKAGKPLDEINYLIEPSSSPVHSNTPSLEPASPMSKRNLQLLRRTPLKLPPPMPEPETHDNNDIVNHYLSQNIVVEPAREKTPEPQQTTLKPGPDVTEDMTDEPTDEMEQIFKGLIFNISGLDEEAITEIESSICEAGGSVAARGAHYTVVPLEPDLQDLTDTCVTVFWLKDCLSQQELLPIQYFHRPVQMTPSKEPPLQGVVACLSTYSGVERAFLDELAKLLGATTQLRFCRRTTPTALASTHLVCPTAAGDKYLGAVKWGLPCVNAVWLLHCAREGRRVSERDYLVGDTKAPPSPVMETEEEIEEHTTKVDKENVMLPPAEDARAPRKSVSSKEGTPRGKINNDEEMSPASRYIAMARQGLLGGDSQETPTRVQEIIDDARQDGELRTPPMDDALSTPNLRGLSPTTRRRLQAVRRGEMPSDPVRTPRDPFDKNPDTPDSAFGAALRPGSGRLSPDARKRLWKFVEGLPSKEQPPVKEKQTPLSEIRQRFLAQFSDGAATPPSEHALAPRKLQLQDHDTPPAKVARHSVDHQSPSTVRHDRTDTPKHETPKTETRRVTNPEADSPQETPKSVSKVNSTLPAAVDAQLQRLSAALSGRASSPHARQRRWEPVPAPESEAAPESQPNTVGWDDTAAPMEQATNTPARPYADKRFMLSSNVDSREELISMIQELGGEVCDGSELDPGATHLLCALPTRSEKMLGAIAAGKWALHPAYVVDCHRSDRSLPEEDYEWGNDRAKLPQIGSNERVLAAAAHRWRRARSLNQDGPFAGLCALIHAPPARRRLLARLVIAGGGDAPDIDPPYENTDISVCFADVKRCPLSSRDAAWLRGRRVPVCAPVLLSSYLTEPTRPDPVAHCLPDYKP